MPIMPIIPKNEIYCLDCGSTNINHVTDFENYCVDFICADCGEYVSQMDFQNEISQINNGIE